jgi:NADH-quinone oxidoreductase subunit N
VLGMMVLVSSHNFITLYLGLELFSLPIYAMVALQRDTGRCIEAAIKYFIMGSVASGLLLYGLSMLFGATHSLDLATVAHVMTRHGLMTHALLMLGLIFTVTAIVFKLGAAPFHQWVPDVYDGAPTSVALFISAAPKIAAFGLLIRLLVDTMPSLSIQWHQVVIVIAILSMAIGNLTAIVQTSMKRLLAYSSIAHMGYMLLGIACATQRGDSAALFYILSYSIMTLGAFGTMILLSRKGFEADKISDYSGLNTRSPWFAFVMLLVMFSMAGVPPIVGFIAKVGVLEALIQVHLVWLAVVALLFAIIGAFYYLRVVKVMYFESGQNQSDLVCDRSTRFVLSLNGILVLLLGIFPGALFALCHNIIF